MKKRFLDSFSFLALIILSIITIITIGVVNLNKEVKAETSLVSRLSGKILLQVEDNGEAWYLNPTDSKRSFLGRPHDAFAIMREEGIGITNDNLSKIPLSLDNLSGEDSDSDGLPDNFEEAIGTNPDSSDTDSDGYDDYTEVKNNYSPRGDNAKRQTIDKAFAKSHQGEIFIQVEGNGEAWYVDTEKNLRHYLGRPSDAFSVMRNLGLGISNINLEKIIIREGKGIQEYDYEEVVVDSNNHEEENSEKKEEYKNHITVTTHKPDLMREFTSVIDVSATINDSSGYDFKEKGFLFDYTMNKDETLKPTLANHKRKLVDKESGLEITAEIDNLLPKSYPYIRAYVITSEDIVYYGETEVLILGNTETVDSIGAPGTPPVFGGGGGGGSAPSEPEYYNLTYTASDNGYLATSAPEVVEEPEWESETNMPEDTYATQGFADENYIYYVNNIIEDGSSGGIEDLSFTNTDFEVQAMSGTSTVYRYNTVDKSWDNMASMPMTVSSPFEAQAFYINGLIYNFYSIEGSLGVYVYNISEDSWVSMEILNNSLLNLSPVGSVYNGKVYLVGNSELDGSYGLAEFDPETGTISDVTTSEYVSDRAFSGVRTVVLNNSFYIFEDLYEGMTNVYSYNFSSDEWSSEIEYNSSMGNAGNLLNYNGNILNVGGTYVTEGPFEIYNDIYIYIPETNSWQKIHTKPHSGFYGGASILNDTLYLGGGMIPGGEVATPTNYNDSIDLSFLTNDYVNDLIINSWQEKASLPYSLTGAGSVVIDDTIYLVGGYTDDEGLESPIIFSYNKESDTWNTEAMLDYSVVNPMTVAVDENIYIFGGRIGLGATTSSVVYNTNTNEITNIEDLSTATTNLFGGVYDDKIYTFGEFIGSGGIKSFNLSKDKISRNVEVQDFELQANDFVFEMYNLNTNSWEEGGEMPGNYFYGTESVLVDGMFYIIGGHNSDDVTTNQTLSYNPETNSWNTLANLPQARAGGSLAYKNGNIYYIGGFDSDFNNKADIFVYNIEDNSWSDFDKELPEKLSKSSTEFIEDDLYIIGGWDIGWSTSGSVYLYEVIEEIKTTILEQNILEGDSGSEVYAIADNGYQFDSWSDGNLNNPRQDNNVQSNIDVTASFSELPYYTLSYNSATGTHLLIGDETSWVNNSPLGENVYNLISGVINDKIYIFGGKYTSETSPVQIMYYYDTQSHSYSYVGNFYEYVNANVAEIVVDDKLYLFGGGGAPGSEFSSSTLVFDPSDNSFTELENMENNRYRAVVGEYNGEIYVFGGYDETRSYIDTFSIYNPETNTWREGGTSPYYIQNIVEVNDKFYFSTGLFDGSNLGYHSYDPETNSWEVLDLINDIGELGPGINYSGDKILYVGGRDFPFFDVTDDIYIYDISDEKWSVSDYNHEKYLYFHDIQKVNDELYVLGGVDEDGMDYSEDLNMKTSIYNFPVDEYSVEVKEGTDGPNVYTNPNIAGSGTFLGWSDGDTSNPRKDTNVESDITVTSEHDIPEYTLTYSSGEHGNLKIGPYSSWENNSNLPDDRSMYDIVSGVVDDKIYILGGRTSFETYWAGNYIYNTETDSYQSLSSNNPDYRVESLDITLEDKIYSIGGRNSSYEYVASSSVFDTTDNTWSEISAPNNIISEELGAVEVYNNEIYLFNGEQDTIESYNPDTDTWSLVTSTMPITGIYDSELVNGIFYLQGGYAHESSGEFIPMLYTYNPEIEYWEERKPNISDFSDDQVNYMSFQNDVGMIMYLYSEYNNTRNEYTAVFDTTNLEQSGVDPGSYFDKFSFTYNSNYYVGNRTKFDFHVINDYVYVIGGILDGSPTNTNIKMEMSNFPVNTYTETVLHGQDGTIIYPDRPGASVDWSDGYGSSIRQDLNVESNVDAIAEFYIFT